MKNGQIRVTPEMILEHIRDGLMIVDLEGCILYANSALAEMLGREGETLAGRNCGEIFGSEECRRFHPRELAPLGKAPFVHFNVTLTRPDGSSGAFCFLGCPVMNEEGEVIALLENFRGMDKLRDVILGLEEVNAAIEAEKKRTEAVVNSIGDGIFTVDGQRRIKSFSRKMEEITGKSRAEVEGKTCMEVLRGSKCEDDCPLTWTLEKGIIVDGCREALRVTGRDVPVSITTALLKSETGELEGVTGILQDLSEVERLHRELEERYSFRNIIGRSRRMQEMFQVIEAVSGTDATVLISGESGTGKELVARAIHYGSLRRNRPFVVVNCAALSDALLESELFGHVQGAFTGASRDKVGRFELAAGGTIFLDEIGDTSPAMQAKLLRVLQEKTFERVGEARTRRVDLRVLAATNRDLQKDVGAGRFREDLYYRLAVVPLRVPALRERKSDIPLLVDHFIEKYVRKYQSGADGGFEGISNRALALLMEYDWPGNVRELEHAIEYALISTRDQRIERAFLPAAIRGLADTGNGLRPAVPSQEPGMETAAGGEGDGLRAALERNKWNVSRTAKELGISRTTLWRRMKRFGVEAR